MAILFNDAKPLEQIDNTPLTDGPIWNLVKIGPAVLEKKTFKDYKILYIAQGQEQITLWNKNLTVTERVRYFEHTLYVPAISL